MQGVASGSWPALAGAPTIGTATAGSSSASVTFTAPTYTGSGITGYTVTSSPGGITGTGASSPITVSGLTNGTAYTFTVTATTAAGQGPASAASNSVTPTAPNIEDVFSTYLYTGTGATQTITNSINLSANGGLVWTKSRNAAYSNALQDTVRGRNNILFSDSSVPNQAYSTSINSFNTDGYTLGSETLTNQNGTTYVGWTFQEQSKFFDIVTATATSGSDLTVSHNLGVAPSCVFIKVTSTTGDWFVLHSSIGTDKYLILDSSAAAATYSGGGTTNWSATSTTLTIPSGYFYTGTTQVVLYLFASNAGGFGSTGSGNVITCGTYTTSGSVATVNLGYEPQWILTKCTNFSTTGFDDWKLTDINRIMPTVTTNTVQALWPNLTNSEANRGNYIYPTSTGFQVQEPRAAATYIYIAIRKGPMKVPTDVTKVFALGAVGSGAYGGGISMPNGDMALYLRSRFSALNSSQFIDRLRGFPVYNGVSVARRLSGNLTDAEADITGTISPGGFSASPSDCPYQEASNNDMRAGISGNSFETTTPTDGGVVYGFRRAPGFFDEVCWTGDGSSGRAINHNLGVVPEMMIGVHRTTSGDNWWVYHKNVYITNPTGMLVLNSTAAASSANGRFSFGDGTNVVPPTSTQFTVTAGAGLNDSGVTAVWYGFATLANVSKVGSYTGTGTLTTIDCGFTSGARFVMIKRTDTTSDWFVWDTARGMVAGSNPKLTMNTVNAEANANSVYTIATGFQLLASPAYPINTSGGTYIFLAIA